MDYVLHPFSTNQEGCVAQVVLELPAAIQTRLYISDRQRKESTYMREQCSELAWREVSQETLLEYINTV